MSRGVLVVAMDIIIIIIAAVRICEAGMLGMLVEISVGLAVAWCILEKQVH